MVVKVTRLARWTCGKHPASARLPKAYVFALSATRRFSSVGDAKCDARRRLTQCSTGAPRDGNNIHAACADCIRTSAFSKIPRWRTADDLASGQHMADSKNSESRTI
eukprot:8277282-Pyramimonas_sp.AAC.1